MIPRFRRAWRREELGRMPTLIQAIQAVESLLYRGIEILEPQDRDDDGLVIDRLVADDVTSAWPEAATP